MSIPSTPIVPNPPGDVKPKPASPPNLLQRLRTERGIPASDLVEVVRAIYPKYDETLHSKVERGEEYGIRLQADAERALREHFATDGPSAAHKPRRSKPHRVQGGWKPKGFPSLAEGQTATAQIKDLRRGALRLSEAVYSLLQQRLARSETTMQDLLEGLILKYITNEGGKP